ncbi:MAG: type II toxin-antitoxin system VapC family toxin [Longimicrobiales bacterium]
MNVIDSSAWLEYFADGPNADYFAPPIEAVRERIVPTITILEVCKRLLQQRGAAEAYQAAAAMRQSTVVSLDADLAIHAAHLGHELGLPLADSVILATARLHDAVLWTQDADFAGHEGVRYRAPRAS